MVLSDEQLEYLSTSPEREVRYDHIDDGSEERESESVNKGGLGKG